MILETAVTVKRTCEIKVVLSGIIDQLTEQVIAQIQKHFYTVEDIEIGEMENGIVSYKIIHDVLGQMIEDLNNGEKEIFFHNPENDFSIPKINETANKQISFSIEKVSEEYEYE